MSILKRTEYNIEVLDNCVDLLKSSNENEKYESVVLTAYIIEQTFKSLLRKLNPLLYLDRKFNSEEIQSKFILKQLSDSEQKNIKTISAKQSIICICIYKPEIKEHKGNLEELFDIRNDIIHSIDDFCCDPDKAVETAASALKACRKLISQYLKITSNEFNPLTSKEFNKLQERERDKRISYIKRQLKKHEIIFEALNPEDLDWKLKSSPSTDNYSWKEETITCPACHQESLDKIGQVDFDWNPDGILTSGDYIYRCRVCELELSEYEYELASAVQSVIARASDYPAKSIRKFKKKGSLK